MATPSSLLAWRIPVDRSPAGYSPWGREESVTTERQAQHIVRGHQSQSPIHPTAPPPPLGIRTFALCLCLYFYFENKFICTIFVDSIQAILYNCLQLL